MILSENLLNFNIFERKHCKNNGFSACLSEHITNRLVRSDRTGDFRPNCPVRSDRTCDLSSVCEFNCEFSSPPTPPSLLSRLRGCMDSYFLATGRQPDQINLQVGVHKLPIFVEDFPKDFFPTFSLFSEHFGKFPLEHPLEKSDDRVPLPIILFFLGPLFFNSQLKNPKTTEKFIWKILYKNRQLVYPYL